MSGLQRDPEARLPSLCASAGQQLREAGAGQQEDLSAEGLGVDARLGGKGGGGLLRGG